MKIADLKDKKILVLGLGKEGLVTLEFLQKHFPDQKVAVAANTVTENLPTNVSETFFGENYLDSLKNFEVIIKSPGIKYFNQIQEAKNQGITITSATDIFFQNCPAPIIGVTGTKGKSTTTSLVYEVLKSSGNLNPKLVGNIGVPALGELESLNEDMIVVFELSSYQLEDLELSPHIAVFTNIFQEHLDHHDTFEKYLEAKSHITAFQKSDDYFIYNSSFPSLLEIAQNTQAQKLAFSLKKDADSLCYFENEAIYYQGQEIIKQSEIPLRGDFNLPNLMPAIIIGKLFEIETSKIKEALKNYQSLPHRLEFVTEKNGIKFYNDSLATIPQATIGALNAFDGDVETLIAGGFDRGVDYNVLGPEIIKNKVKNLILFPDTGAKIWQSVCASAPEDQRPQKFDVTTMEEAVKTAFEVTSPDKICLLSPASTSFNMFKDYIERGNKFKEAIEKF